MLRHDLVPENPELSEMSERSKLRKLDQDGLGSVEYDLVEVEYLPLYTSIKISLRPPPVKVKAVEACFEHLMNKIFYTGTGV